MGAGAALTDRGAAIKIIDDNGGFENERKWNRNNRISGVAGNKKGTAECGRKEFCGAGKQCGRYSKSL